MSAQANIVINDGQAAPVAHTFAPRGATLDLAKWNDVSGGIGIGMPAISISNTHTGKGSDSVYRVDVRVTVPVMEVISGSDGGYTPVPKVAFSDFCKIEFAIPDRATLQNRKDILAYVKNLMAHAVMSDTVVDLNPAY